MAPQSGETENTTKRSPASAAGRLLLFALETLLLLALAAAAALMTVGRGPSESARRDLSALASGYGTLGRMAADCLGGAGEEKAPLPEKESAPAASPAEESEQPPAADAPAADAWGLTDEDGDGLILCPVYGRGYTGLMLVVLDPTRVTVGFMPDRIGNRGRTVGEFAEQFGAIAAINAGGFLDEGGSGDGSTPDSLVVYEGEIYCAGRGVRQGFAGIDAEGKLHVGKPTADEIREMGIRWGVSFGPVLIRDGVVADPETLKGDLNPRSAIGQREDGAILLLVVDGRQVVSMGATVTDMAAVMQEFGAVNACNLDGGTSSLLWYRGEYLNDKADLFRPRPVPDVFLVMEKGAQS